MREFIFDHLEHVLCALLLVSRLGDIGSTYLVSPTLQLEANPIARRLGWRFIVLTTGACLIPYVSIDLALMALVPFLMVSAGNTAKIWVVRTMGELEYKNMLLRLAARSKVSYAILGAVASALFIILAGLVICFFYPDPVEDPGYWLGAGLMLYGFVVGFYGSLSFARLFKQAKATRAT
jgi:hypothetical protein